MASGSQDPVEDEERGLTLPLLSSRSDAPRTTLKHKDGVYSFVLFVPPLQRKRHGHYCGGPVFLALILLVLTVTCQLSLSQIAGAYITNQSKNFKVTLIRHQRWYSHAITPLDFALDWVSRTSNIFLNERILDPFHRKPPVSKEDDCCHGVECISVRPCCPASQPRPNRTIRPSSAAARAKALASKGLEGMKNVTSKVGEFVFGSTGSVALCRRADDGSMDCSPPSFAYVSAWHELDINGDGVWTMEEAAADDTNLGCRLGLSAVDFFHSAARGIIKDAKDTAENSYVMPIIPTSIENRRAIPREYFEWYKGIVVLCVAFDVSRCGQLVQQGIFDGAIGQKNEGVRGGMRGGIYDLDSALDYCQRMLRPNGVCEQTLPHTYRLYRARVSEKCGSPSFHVGGKFINPHDNRDVMSVVQVDFSEHAKYVGATEWKFQVFIALILTVWYVTLVLEFSRIVELANFLMNFKLADESEYGLMTPAMRRKVRGISSTRLASMPSLNSVLSSPRFKAETPKSAETGALLVTDISRPHRNVCFIMWGIRVFLWWYMLDVGTTFLLATFSYDDLLFNAVALAFIFELQELLYAFLVSDELKKALQDAQTTSYPTSLPVEGWKTVLISRTFWGLVLIPFFVCVVVFYNINHTIIPSSEALNCACFQTGPNCMASGSFSKAWWDRYWQDTRALAKVRASYFSR